jgi:hypothetical protein
MNFDIKTSGTLEGTFLAYVEVGGAVRLAQVENPSVEDLISTLNKINPAASKVVGIVVDEWDGEDDDPSFVVMPVHES